MPTGSGGDPSLPGRRRFCAGVTGGGIALAAGCRGPGNAAPRLATAAELSPAERLYGLAPQRDADVVYQPDVAIVGDGARSIIAMAPDGLTWGIDSGARGIDRVRPGQVLFVTGNCVGRVLGLKRDGDVTAVVLGPVDLTEVFRECQVELEQPFDPSQASALAMPEFPGAQMSIGAAIPGSHFDTPDPGAMHWPAPGEPEPSWQPTALAEPSHSGGRVTYEVEPILDPRTIGLRTRARNESVDVVMSSALHLRDAKVRFWLDISAAGIKMAGLELDAALQLRFGFDAKAYNPDALANIKDESRMVPLDLNLPFVLSYGGIGLGVSLQHRFLVNTAFSARGSWFYSLGHWDLSGMLSMSYVNGKWHAPRKLTIAHTHESMLQGMKHASVGVTGMVLSHQIRLMVGLGAGPFRAGPFLACNNSIALARGSNIVRPVQPQVCRAATLAIGLGTGVGYEIPRIVAAALNFFLRLLRMREIPASGGIKGPVYDMLKRTDYSPDNDFCREAAGGPPT
jgi:hypothetical protein